MREAHTLMGKPYRYEGSLEEGLVVQAANSTVTIDRESIDFIRHQIATRSPVWMGANREPLVKNSVGEALRLETGKSPQFLSYVVPLLVEQGFCRVTSSRPYEITYLGEGRGEAAAESVEPPIGGVVKRSLPAIFAYCDTQDHQELERLLTKEYSRQTFGLSLPFCKRIDEIAPEQHRRYWTEVYLVRGARVRVTSQWTTNHRVRFDEYLRTRGIEPVAAGPDIPALGSSARRTPCMSSRTNARYRSYAIGNAQNAFIRNILGNLGSESFTERDWEATKDYFGNRCAYCGAEEQLLIEHAVPINRENLGEHRLGNMVPSCRACNAAKGSKDFHEFLGENTEAIERIETYMETRNYVPLEDNEQLKMILNMAHAEVAALAKRYVTIINSQFGPAAAADSTEGGNLEGRND